MVAVTRTGVTWKSTNREVSLVIVPTVTARLICTNQKGRWRSEFTIIRVVHDFNMGDGSLYIYRHFMEKKKMKTIILIAVLFFTANVAGAETLYCDYTTLYTSNPPKYACVVNGEKVMMTNEEINAFGEEQPETKESAKCQYDCIYPSIKILNGNAGTGPNYYLEGLKHYHECMMKCQPDDAEKWREKCDEALKLMDLAKTNTFAPFATAYCTRYNSALLEEIKDKIKSD